MTMTGCSNDAVTGKFSVGDADNAIVLSAGMAKDDGEAATRAGAEDNHSKHLTLKENTQLALRVDGTWTGHDPESIKKTATAAIGEVTGGNHNEVVFTGANQLYWDDYGTADPANKETGRDAGLTIYAAAVNGVETAPTVSSWTEMEWSVDADQTSGWEAQDLLTSNNVRKGSGDGCYKFDDKASGKLLEFTHAMTKVTVNLTAGEGFAEGKFVEAPAVTLLGFNKSGTVNVENKTTEASSTAGTITPHTISAAAGSATASYDALVFPGNQFADATDVLKIEADGNIYYVNATKINAANTEASNTFEQGKNYIFNITVNKTEVVVTATVVNWVDVTAETVQPVINVSTTLGDKGATGEGFTKFDFYMRTDGDANYSAFGNSASGTAADGTTAWTFGTRVFWPSHNIHYHMRGVYPSETVVATSAIAVQDAAYNSNAFPTNLMVGAPELAESQKMCNNTDHTAVDMSERGICAREATINLNFRYMMSQVEVRLTTSSDESSDKVTLANAVVEIVGGYTNGTVNIHNRTVATTGDPGPFTVPYVAGENANYRHATIVPQELTEDLKFKITITNSDGTQDVYFATIKDVAVSEGGAKAALIFAWQSGKHYIYTLNMRKTEIKVSATITDWIEAQGSTNIWM